MSKIQEIRIGRTIAKVLDIGGTRVIDVRHRGRGLIFMGVVDQEKWPVLKLALEKLESMMVQAGWL